MVVYFSICLKKPLIPAGCDRESVFQLQHPHKGIGLVRVLGILNTHPPGSSIGPATPGQYVPSQADRSPRDVIFLQNFRDAVRGVSLGNAAQVDLGAGRQRRRIPRQSHVLRPYQGQQPIQLLPGRHPVLLLRKAPGGDHRGNGDIKGAVRCQRVFFRRRQQAADFLSHGNSQAAGAVELGDHAFTVRPGQQALQPPHLILRQVIGVGALFPIGRKDHHRVHGNDLDTFPCLVGADRLPAAAGQSGRHQHGQNGRRKTSHKLPPHFLDFCHIKVVYHALRRFSTGNPSEIVKSKKSIWLCPCKHQKNLLYYQGMSAAVFMPLCVF